MRRRIRRGNPDRQRPSNSLVEQRKQVRRTINDQPGWNNRVALAGRFALSCRKVTFSELFEVHFQGSLPGSLPGFTCRFTRRLCFHAILRAWLAWDAGCLGWCKSVPIGTVFRSKGQKCTKLVRFSGFLVLLSRFVVVVQGIIPARGWIQEEGWAGF